MTEMNSLSQDAHQSATEPATQARGQSIVSDPGLNQHQSLGLSFPKSSNAIETEQGALSYLFDLDTESLFEVRSLPSATSWAMIDLESRFDFYIFQDFQMDLDESAQGDDADKPQAELSEENRSVQREDPPQDQTIDQQMKLQDSNEVECENPAAQAGSPQGKPQQGASIEHSELLATSPQPIPGANGDANDVKSTYLSDVSENITPEKQVMQSTESVHATPDDENINTAGSMKKGKKRVQFKRDLVNVRTFYKGDDSLPTQAYKRSPEKAVRPILKSRTKRRKVVPVTNVTSSPERNERSKSNPSPLDYNIHIPAHTCEREQPRRYLAEHLVDLDCTMQTMVSEANSLMRRLHRLHQRIH